MPQLSVAVTAGTVGTFCAHDTFTVAAGNPAKAGAFVSLTVIAFFTLPLLFALFFVFRSTIEFRGVPFMWMTDISLKDPFYILPLLMGATMIIQTRLNPEPPDPVQAKIMKIMPLVFSVFFFFFPAGLVLYWLVNNVLSIAQQWHITRSMESAAPAHGRR